MTLAEQRIEAILTAYQERTLARWRGYEQIFLTELVRGLDEAAFAFTLAPNSEQLRREDGARRAMLRGAALALAPWLKIVRALDGGLPWVPTNVDLARAADGHLINCGQIADVARVAALERYGLATCRFVTHHYLVIEVAADDAEHHDIQTLRRVRAMIQEGRTDLETALHEQTPLVHQRLDAYVRIDRDDFIRYDNDEELVAYYRMLASVRATDFFESEALPGAARLGDQSFDSWCDMTVEATGRILQHAAYATRLKSLHPHLQLRNLLTIAARAEDLLEVLHQAGEPTDDAEGFMSAMTLDSESAEDYASDHETPVSLYIPVSRDFGPLPCFGALLNPFYGLVRTLRRHYRSDWDRAVGGREGIFRQELKEVFRAPRFFVTTGPTLRRSDGTAMTDIDAVVFDREFGTLAVLQLKWHDVFGRSLRERHSRRVNLLRANEWVARVFRWLSDVPAAELSARLGLGAVSPVQRTVLFVVSRYATLFTENTAYDDRSAWLSWADVITNVHPESTGDVLRQLEGRFRGGRRVPPSERIVSVQNFDLPGLRVEVRLGKTGPAAASSR